MGQVQKNCCVDRERESVLEVSMAESFRSSFCRNSSYESPIPDEVFVPDQYSSIHSENFIDEWSTDIDKGNEISEGLLKTLPKPGIIKLEKIKH